MGMFLSQPPPSFHYFKVVQNGDSGQTPPLLQCQIHYILCFSLNPSLSKHIAQNFEHFHPTIWPKNTSMNPTYGRVILLKPFHPSFGFGITVLADKISSNIFRAIFWTPGLVPVILDIAYLVAVVLRIPNWPYTSLQHYYCPFYSNFSGISRRS